MSVATDFLTKLFRRADAVSLKGEGLAAPERLGLTKDKCPAFFAMRNLADAMEFCAELDVAKGKGAITVEPLPHTKPPHNIKAIAVADLRTLAGHLKLPLSLDHLAHAREALEPYTPELPVLVEILAAWRLGKKVRGAPPDPEEVKAVVDAARVVLHRRTDGEDHLLRRISIQLFHNSKRIEALGRWLDLLYTGEIASSGLDIEQVHSGLGLLHEPQAFHLSANGEFSSAGEPSRLVRPYLGIAPKETEAIAFDVQPRALLTIENKQTFHEFARVARQERIVLIYTAGMPSPSWLRVFGLALAALDPEVPIYHYGDIDVGGFRIAATISHYVADAGRTLLPWLMDPHDLQTLGCKMTEAGSRGEVTSMCRWAERAGWPAIADAVRALPMKAEQEYVEPHFPR